MIQLQYIFFILSFIFSGADLYSICADASLISVSRKIKELEEEKSNKNPDKDRQECNKMNPDGEERQICRDVVVELRDFEVAVGNFVPSVTKEDLDYYKGVKDNMEEK